MIRGFANRETAEVFAGRRSRRLPPSLQRRAERKLKMLHAAQSLRDLLVPPSHRLEKLRGDRLGQYSVRIDRQWRLCFRWHAGDAFAVEIVDYH